MAAESSTGVNGSGKRSNGVVFSQLEKQKIVDGVEEFLPLFSQLQGDAATYGEKLAKWDIIRDRCAQVYPYLQRSTKAVKKKWGQMVYTANKKAKSSLSPMDQAVLALHHQIAIPTVEVFDDNDNVILANNESPEQLDEFQQLWMKKQQRLEAVITQLKIKTSQG